MSKPQGNHRIFVCWFLALFVGILAGCSSVAEKRISRVPVPSLTSEEQNRLEYFFLEAERLKAKGEFAAAFELFRHCEAIDPNSAQIKASLSPYYFVLGNDSLGIKYQELAWKLDPDNYWYAWQLAAIYQSGQSYGEAIRVYEEMLRRFPEKEDPLYALIELYPQNGEYDKAVKLLNELEKKMGKSEELSMQKFQLYLYQEKGKEAFQEIESLVKEYPDDLRYRCILGDLYLSHQKYPEALKAYQDILAEDPTNEPVMLSMADYYEAVGDTAAYRSQVDSVLFSRYVSDENRGRLMRQIIMKSTGSSMDSTRIIALFDRMASQYIGGEDLLMLNAQYLISLNMTERASPVLKRLLQMDPSNDLVRKQLLAEAIRAENSRLVVDLCLPLTEKAPESVDDLIFFYYLAASYYQLDDYDSALLTLHKALGYVTDEVKSSVVSDFYAMMGDLYHLQKKDKEAYAAYDSALVYNSMNIGALNNYAYYLSEEQGGDLVKAERMSFKTIEAQPDNDTYLDTYAWILFKLKRYDDAKVYIDKALQNGGTDNAVELDHAGDIYMKLNLKEEAINFWKQALKKEIEEPEKVEQKIERAK